MFVNTPSAPDASEKPATAASEPLHLMLVRTPTLTPRGRAWLERTQRGTFDGRELQRLIRFEKLSLG